MLAAALRAGAFVFAAYATGRVLSRRARAGDERRIEQLRRECGTDMLTGLLNRRGGQEKAETMLAMCRRCEKPMAVLMADIDHFKEYNDAHGHLAGDGALCRVGGALQSVLARSSDMVCRFGGEEFLLCTPCRDTAEAMRQAARLRRAVEELGPCAPDGCCAGPLTVSVGGMYVDEAAEGLSFRNAQGMLLLGGGSHRTGKQGGGWRELEAFAKRHYPRAHIRYRWAAQDCMTLDGVPYIGPYSARTENLYVATGFNKWGMTSAMAAAMLLTDMVQGKRPDDAPVFSPSRSMLRPQLALNALEAAASLLTPTAPRCPHMGCALKWNAQEHSWDCPCHGSRFTQEGGLIENPAMRDLELEG